MAYFQNVFDSEFRLDLIDGVTFRVKSNLPNSSQVFQCWNASPYDLSSAATLTINYSFNQGRAWTPLAINVASGAVSSSAVTAAEVVTNLNANATFQALFLAVLQTDNKGHNYVAVRSNRARTEFRIYVANSGAESKLRFNKKAGVSELPSRFARHTIANINNYSDSYGNLQQMDLTTVIDQKIVEEAELSYLGGGTNANATVTMKDTSAFSVGDSVVVYNGTATVATTLTTVTASTSLTLNNNWTGATGEVRVIPVHADWQLLRGRSQEFMFRKSTLDNSRLSVVLDYPAGSKVGDMAIKTSYIYAGSAGTDVEPIRTTQEPYTLTAGDLITPP